MLGLAAQFPAFSTVISNVPGPREQLYWNGARMDGVYPASIVFDGFAMNITLVSYAKSLDFGIVACRRSLPEIQRMIDYLENALVELEDVVGVRSPANKKAAAKKPVSNKQGATKKAKVRRPAAKKTASKRGTTARTAGEKARAKTKAKTKTKAKAQPKARPKVKASANRKVQPKQRSRSE